MGVPGSGLDFCIRRAGSPHRDIVPDRVVKEDGLLCYQCDLPAQVIDGDLPNVSRANAHGAALRIIEPQQQVGERGFAGAAAADQGHQLAGLDREVDPPQDRFLAVIEVYVIEVDVRLAGLERNRGGRIGDGADHVHQLEHPLVGRTGLLHLVAQAGQVLDGRIHQEYAANERHERSHVGLGVGLGAKPHHIGEHQRHPHAAEELRDLAGNLVRPHHAHHVPDVLPGGRPELG